MWSSETPTVAVKGTMKKMKCIFSGYPTPKVHWTMVDGSPLAEKVEVGSFGQEIVIYDVDYSDEGRYRCHAQNLMGPQAGTTAVTKDFQLRVESKPFWIKEPQDVNSSEEEDAEIVCQAGGVPRPKIQWYINGEDISMREPDPRRKVTENKIFYKNLTSTDAQVFQCNATNKHGYIFANAYLNVLAEPPSFIEIPAGVTKVAEEQTATLVCRVFGAPDPKITWYRGKEQDRIKVTDARFEKQQNGDLIIRQVQSQDEDSYICYAKNKFGDEEAGGDLIVRNKTMIIEAPESQVVNASTNVVFNCKAITDGKEKMKLKIDWLKNGELINYQREGRISKNVNDHSLTLTQVTVEDSGTYTCKASVEDLDSDSATAALTVKDKPDPPTNLEMKGCGARAARISWVPGNENNDEIIEFVVFQNTSFDDQGHFDKVITKSKGTNNARISVSPWGNYTFHVKARNSLGYSERSNFSTVCTTPPDKPHTNPGNVCTATDGAPDELIITWDPMPRIQHNGEGFHYIVGYRPYDQRGGETIEIRVNDYEADKYVIDGMETFKEFEVYVQAANNEGKSHQRPTHRKGYSGEDTPLVTPQGFTVDEDTKNATYGEFTWEAVEEDPTQIRGFFKGYQVRFWKDDDPDDVRTEDVILNSWDPCPELPSSFGRKRRAAGELITANVDDLWPYSDITAGVLVLNGGKSGSLSDTISFRTPEGFPGVIGSFRVSERGSHHFKVEWTPPMEENGIIIGYRLGFVEIGGGKALETIEVDNPFARYKKIRDLKEDTQYVLYIWAKTSIGPGTEYFTEDRTKVATAPDAPILADFETGDTFVNVSWTPSESDPAENPGSEYIIRYRKKGDDDTEWLETDPEGEHNWLNVTDLEPGETYEIVVIARNGNGDETSSEPKYITIGPDSVPTPIPGVIVGEREEVVQTIAQAGWFIGLICVIIFLLIILCIVCLIKRNRGGKYPVHEKEKLRGRDPDKEDEEAGFGEYTRTPYMPLDSTPPKSDQPEYKKSAGSLESERKPLEESDSDSMAEYYETDPSKFNEDGSFIGQYGGKKTKPSEKIDPDATSPSALSTFV